ncbi:MAG: SpoIIE family protein phosphatase [Rhodobacteraceae bacterium]|nr:SpoIIE family protein phosphatase [Paracoccaceae bacterium]
MEQVVNITADGGDSRPKTILVVDDSKLQRRILGSNLDAWGYEVFEAESGIDALEICKSTRVDIILSDWMMPEMDGLRFCRELRALKQAHYGYFILLTSKDSKDEIAEGLEVGADDFLTKPVNSGELRARLHAGERLIGMQRELMEKNRSISRSLSKIKTLYQAIDRDLAEARKLQQSLVPASVINFGQAEVSFLLQSSGHVGGDMIGLCYGDVDRLGLFAFDVSGHGVSSALMTARLAGYLGATNPAYNIAMEQHGDGLFRPRPPEQVALLLNSRMLEEFDTDLYLTLLLADIDLGTGRVRAVQAGHPHPAILRRDGSVEFIGPGGMPVGLLPDAGYQAFEFYLQPGERMLICSDGFTEAEGDQGAFLDESGLGQMLVCHANARGPDLLAGLVRDTRTFVGSDEVGDDLSAVLLEYHGAAEPPG